MSGSAQCLVPNVQCVVVIVQCLVPNVQCLILVGIQCLETNFQCRCKCLVSRAQVSSVYPKYLVYRAQVFSAYPKCLVTTAQVSSVYLKCLVTTSKSLVFITECLVASWKCLVPNVQCLVVSVQCLVQVSSVYPTRHVLYKTLEMTSYQTIGTLYSKPYFCYIIPKFAMPVVLKALLLYFSPNFERICIEHAL